MSCSAAAAIVPFLFVTILATDLPNLMGQSLYAQGLLVDLTPAAPVFFALTNGVQLTLGS